MKFCADKQCERTGQMLGPDQFYEKKDSADRTDFYCKRCRSRRGRESYERRISGQPRRKTRVAQPEPVSISKNVFAFSLVYDAVNRGCKTREEIRRETKLPYDAIGDALAELLEVKGLRLERLPDGGRSWHLAA